jgi:hypothetical protein
MLALSSGPMRWSKMKSALSLILIVCLVVSALPVTAQEQTATPGAFDLRSPASQAAAGSLARAVAREAVRLAAAEGSIPSGGDIVEEGHKPAAKSNWLRVRAIEPGTEVFLTVKGAPPDRRYFVLVDESELTFLNLTDATLPRAARDVLRDVASDHPEYLPAAQRGETFRLEENVRLGPDGVFVGGVKIAELGQIIEQIAQNSVAEISVSTRHIKRAVGWGAVIGAGAGLVTGLLISNQCVKSHACEKGTWIVVAPIYAAFGGGTGSGIGAVLGASRGKTQDVIYRAP